ncbi:hypothetical protein ACFX10_003076 [Malus domestica]
MHSTMRVEKTKSSSLRPKLGRETMSLRTQELTLTTSSIRTLKGNCRSVAIRDLHPLRNIPRTPNPETDDDDEDESSEIPSPPRLHPPLFPPAPAQPPPIPPENESSSFWTQMGNERERERERERLMGYEREENKVEEEEVREEEHDTKKKMSNIGLGVSIWDLGLCEGGEVEGSHVV